MVKKHFYEGDCSIIFDGDWDVIKLDAHKYYISISGQGIKCCDFMAVHPYLGVAFIEIKNYTKTTVPNDINDILQAKKTGSLRLVSVVNQYFKRQIYFKIATWLKQSWMMKNEWKIWTNAAKHISNENYFFLADISCSETENI